QSASIISSSPKVPSIISKRAAYVLGVRSQTIRRKYEETKKKVWKDHFEKSLESVDEIKKIHKKVKESEQHIRKIYDCRDGDDETDSTGDETDSNKKTDKEAAKVQELVERDYYIDFKALSSTASTSSTASASIRRPQPISESIESELGSSFNVEEEEDTMEELCLVKAPVDRLVGPGKKSSKLYCEHWTVNGYNISDLLMASRREILKKQSTLEASDEIVQINFIFTENNSRPSAPFHSATQPASALVASTQVDNTSILGRYININLLSGQIWNMAKYTGLKKGNEDTFTTNVIVPIIFAFSGIDNLIFRWRGDVFQPGRTVSAAAVDPNEFPDFSVSYNLGAREEYLLVMDTKPPNTAEQRLVDDEVKLANMMKKGLDSLLCAGYESSILGMLVQGPEACSKRETGAPSTVVQYISNQVIE
ncbi:hypothetical protein BGX27_001888, partial [Mortierella sp. AM989]